MRKDFGRAPPSTLADIRPYRAWIDTRPSSELRARHPARRMESVSSEACVPEAGTTEVCKLAGVVMGGHFRIDALLGKGGMGEVYAATDLRSGKRVALKRMGQRSASNPSDVARFLREAGAGSVLNHPNVVSVYDVFEDERRTPVIVMELLQGESLRACLEREQRLPLCEVAAIFSVIARALCAAHARGIVHRDLKPDNIFLSRDADGSRVVKVLDFGIAKFLHGEPHENASTLATSVNRVLGTPDYMSMEQAMGDAHIDQRTDVWSFGVMMVECLTGRRPFRYQSLGQMYVAFIQEDVPLARILVPGIAADIAALLDACLHKDRSGRLFGLAPAIEVLERYARVPDAVDICAHARPVHSTVLTPVWFRLTLGLAMLFALYCVRNILETRAPPGLST